MERIHTADDPIFIGYLKSLLEAEGIACNVRNELLLGGSGELPPNECWPELWVLHEADAQAARAQAPGRRGGRGRCATRPRRSGDGSAGRPGRCRSSRGASDAASVT